MASSFGGDRWTCRTCRTSNKPWRDVCFGKDCSTTKIISVAGDGGEKANTDDDDDDDNYDIFKDENSKVIARLPRGIAKRVRTDLGRMVEGLNTYAGSLERIQLEELELDSNDNDSKKEATRRTCQLQRKMRQGLQQIEDFDDPVALAGYTKRKFAIRAVVALQLFRSFFAKQLQEHDGAFCSADDDNSYRDCSERLSMKDLESARLISVGGGPGNDIFGAMLFERHFYASCLQQQQVAQLLNGEENSNNDDSIRHRFISSIHHFDLSPLWAPIVDQVSLLSQEHRSPITTTHTPAPVTTSTCNLHEPLTAAANQALADLVMTNEVDDDATTQHHHHHQQQQQPVILLFCYVINEVMQTPSGEIPPLLRDLIQVAQAAASSRKIIFLFREPNTASLQAIVSWYAGELQFMELDDYGSYGLVLPQ